jgi:hypothetical protein
VMSNSFGFGGANTSLALRRWDESDDQGRDHAGSR